MFTGHLVGDELAVQFTTNVGIQGLAHSVMISTSAGTLGLIS